MKSLIVYYSHSGNNEMLAHRLKDRIKSDIFQITEKKKRKTISILFEYFFPRKSKILPNNLNVKEYDTVIFVSPVWGSKIASPLRAFIQKEKDHISNYYYITICNGIIDQKEKLISELTSLLMKAPLHIVELWINNLLPEDQKNKVKHTFNYKITPKDLDVLNLKIESLVNLVNG